MCGICAIVAEESDHRSESIHNMVEGLKHRGPDRQRVSELPEIALGHCRLKIIDTSDASNQPYQDERYHLVYNGELYNFEQLREQLIEMGYSFATEGDTEVLFKWLVAFGSDRLEELKGMYAFVFWDEEEGSLLAARDPMGIKPLYYRWDQVAQRLATASELSILSESQDKPELDTQGLREYLQFQSVRSPHSLVSKINKLPAGHYLSYTGGEQLIVEPFDYWPNRIRAAKQASDQEHFQEELQQRVFESVQKRLVSNVPLGAFLSGGVDSSVVVAMMRKASDQPIRTFTLGFQDESLDERAQAAQIAEHLGTDHTEIVLSEDEILDKIPKAVSAMDVPSGDAINTYLVAEAAKSSGLTVALSGLGGDELVGGYPSFRGWDRAQLLHRFPFHDTLSKILPGVGVRQQEKLIYFFSGERQPERWVNSLRSVFLPDWLPQNVLNKQSPCAVAPDLTDGQRLSREEILRYTEPLLLNDSDQMGMAHALEIRVPLLDRDLVGWMLQQPDAFRFDRSGHPKQALIDTISDVLPQELLDRPKQGFVLPMDRWLRGPLKEYTKTGLFETDLDQLLSSEYLQKVWEAFIEKSDPRYTWSRIWTLSVLGYWMRNKGVQV
jgi:asparagine synthase (glutamine-hydrolysing)